MTCPRCYFEFEAGPTACPECGIQLVRNVSGVMKTSAVMIAAGEEQGFYRSVQDVPEPLRTRLIESTNSANAGTIVIADRAGKEQITQVMAKRESSREKEAMADAPPAAPKPPRQIAGIPWVVWAGALVFLIAAGIITAVFLMH